MVSLYADLRIGTERLPLVLKFSNMETVFIVLGCILFFITSARHVEHGDLLKTITYPRHRHLLSLSWGPGDLHFPGELLSDLSWVSTDGEYRPVQSTFPSHFPVGTQWQHGYQSIVISSRTVKMFNCPNLRVVPRGPKTWSNCPFSFFFLFSSSSSCQCGSCRSPRFSVASWAWRSAFLWPVKDTFAVFREPG